VYVERTNPSAKASSKTGPAAETHPRTVFNTPH
jgi:hypothetical protein